MRRLARLPIAILLVAMAGLWVANPPGSYGSDSLIMALNFIFSTLASALIVLLVSRSFLTRGTPGLLMLGCGVLTWGASGLVAKAVNQHDANLDVTVHNTCVWLSALFHLAGALLLLQPRRALQARELWLGAAYTGVLGVLGLVVLGALHGYAPTFFVQGEGGTTVRQWVLGSAIAMFLSTAGLLKWSNRRPLSAFLYWYILALGLIALGLFGILIESVYASLLSWMGLIAQFLSGVYMLIAAIAAVRETGTWHISLEAALRQSEERYAAFAAATFEGIVESEAGRIVDCNEQFAQMLGRTVGELKGTAIADLIAPEDRERIAANIGKNRESVIEHASVRKDGMRIIVEARGRPVGPRSPRRYTAVRDITERKRAEEALRASEEQFRALADAITNLASWANADGYIMWYNRRWYEYTGTTPEQMEGWGWQSVHDPQALPEVLERWKASIATGEPFEMTFPLRGADGQFRRFLTRIQPLKDAHGRVVRWFGTNTDVEDLKRVEESLRESEQFARLLVECNRDCVKVLDLDGKLLSMSQNGQKLLEIADIKPYLNAFYVDFWRPEDQPRVREMMAAARAGGVGRFEAFCPTANGKPRWWDVDLTPIPGPDGKPQRLLAVSHDITERKRREQEVQRLNRTLQALSNSSHAMGRARQETEYLTEVCRIVVEDCGHAMVWVGYAGADEDRTVRPVASAGFDDGYLETLRITWADTERGRGPTGTAIRTGEVSVCRSILTDPRLAPWRDDAVRRGYRSSIALPLVIEGRVFGALTIYCREADPFAEGEVRLLTELAGDLSYGIEAIRLREAGARAAVELREAKETAEAASKAKDHFLAVLSHELRNPLSPVLATASMLREDPRFDADTQEQLEIICRNAELEARLIDDLLDVTRIERGKVELDRRPIELSTIIQRAVEVCLPDIKARKLEFGVDAPDGPYPLDADAARMQQVFWNLLNNAVKFTPPGGCVGFRCRRDGDGFVVVQVNDSGEGIEPAALSRLFNAFEQIERSITRQFGGLGLGLTISKGLVEMHGGTIHAHSEGKGKGATFTVRLPMCDSQLPTREPAAAPDLQSKIKNRKSSWLRITATPPGSCSDYWRAPATRCSTPATSPPP